MGAKTSKSANISGTPKKEAKEVVAAVEGENHVNGVAADTKLEVKDSNNTNTTNHVVEVAKEEVKEVVKEIQEAAANDVKVEKEVEKETAPAAPTETTTPASPEAAAVNGTTSGGEEKENKTPVKEGEAKPEKKKVTKRFSLRKLSFLRREKKVKEDKQKNGEVTSPEKKDEKKEDEVVANGDGGDVKPAEEIKSDETKKEDETPATTAAAAAAVVEKVEPTEPTKTEEPAKVEEKVEAVVVPSENGEALTETVTKEVTEIIENKKLEPTITETVTTNGIHGKDVDEIISAVENGVDEKLSKEVAVSNE